MYDRAMQALYALALEPVAETTADGKSFGFRKGRCAQDACEYLFNALSRKHISRSGFWRVTSKVASTISAMIGFGEHPHGQEHFEAVLKGRIYLSARTLSYRGRNSARWYYLPILANMTLDGIEKKLVERFHTNALGKVDSRFKNAH